MKQKEHQIIADGPASWSRGAWVFGLIIAALWIFALVTGSAPGVVTAVVVVLFILGGIGRGIMRRQRGANT